jgi:hypothetical protein
MLQTWQSNHYVTQKQQNQLYCIYSKTSLLTQTQQREAMLKMQHLSWMNAGFAAIPML